MSFVHDDNTLDLSRESGYVLHLKAKLAAQTNHMDWLQGNLNAAKLERNICVFVAGLSVMACLVMYVTWGA